ncbi:uncharacterized protein LOC122070638 isoform X2 [Macadamia integrifolia]|uniref:uncharacterized protein LOC122070638 isoform X2 n=1 Tax=Macadamia integrifolia TaxID=60698 RepID=UPI001C4F5FC7|nr:uncharacterized protein LOC122070638 isoform X2 [Macadamia integrifolia]
MSVSETGSIAAHVASLTKSFGVVPPTAVPAVIDCILASTGLSSSSLFSSLLDAISNLIKDNAKEERDKPDGIHSGHIASFTTALCYLLRKSTGTNPDLLQSFIWRAFLPLMKINADDYGSLNQIVELFFDVVMETNSWGLIEVSLVPFSLRSVGLFMGMSQNEESAIYQWNTDSIFKGPNELMNLDSEKEFMLSLPLPISCHILTSLLYAALRSCQSERSTSDPMAGSVYYFAEKFAGNLLWDLCDMTTQVLSQCSERRSCLIRLLLPFIFKAFVSHSSFVISVNGHIHILSREYFFRKIWKCCIILFSLGPLERKDAYDVLSLYFSFHTETCEVVSHNGAEEFDVRSEQEFWDEIKGGLVDKEGLVRKQSLHILKISLGRIGGRHCNSGVSETNLGEKYPTSHSITKRGKWAEKEAKSLGVGKICSPADPFLTGQQRWEAFLLLYEMLEEYGTHLVEAAWTHQVTLLLHLPSPHDSSSNSIGGGADQIQMETLEGIFSWLAILWERGFFHENPQVRCLIMQSFLDIDWKNHYDWAKQVPKSFVLGPLMEGLNDTVHHRDFGVKGVYSSKTIEGASNFFGQFSSYFSGRERVTFLCNLASVAKQESFGRAGLMALAVCIASAAVAAETPWESEAQWYEGGSWDVAQPESSQESLFYNNKAELLDILRLIIEDSKQHFNPHYRLRVSTEVFKAASSVICPTDVPLEILLHFFSMLPREFADYGGSLRGKVQEWFSGLNRKCSSSNSLTPKMQVLDSLYDFPERFIKHQYCLDSFVIYDDEDLDAWVLEVQRWIRLLFLLVTEEHHLEPIFRFIQSCAVNISGKNLEWVPVKFLILSLGLVEELQIIQKKSTDFVGKVRSSMEAGTLDKSDQSSSAGDYVGFEKFARPFFSILGELVSFAKSACSTFWSIPVFEDVQLPSSVRGKLGGPSQRRLASCTTASVLQAILSMKTVATISLWSAHFKNDVQLDSAFNFLWNFVEKVISSPTYDSEAGGEIRLAAYEALAPVFRALGSDLSPLVLNMIMENDGSLGRKVTGKPLLDSLVLSFLQNINDLLAGGVLARSRRAILMNLKWLCLDSLLSIPYHAIEHKFHLHSEVTFFSDLALRFIFADIVDSLENAGESDVLPMLRSVRSVLGIFASSRMCSFVSSSNGVDTQRMWQLVQSSWILHVSCNKRRVAPIAALLSSVLHTSLFSDENMHETADQVQGPLKWFIEKILDEGTKSPRTIRLAALHLTGLWLLNPRTIKYYVKELKLLSLYGSVAFDEDFEAELVESHDARTEVSLLATNPDSELTEVFINTELYARVSVATLFYKLADMAAMLGSLKGNDECFAALQSGKLFLLELLDSAVNDKDLSKELYKKYSGVHRRKVRAWQMICVLSRFVDEDIVHQVTSGLHIGLYRNNLPAVRQYLETFAIQIYLKFPSLVGEQLIPVFHDYNMRPQALSSYVFIAANVILHASEVHIQLRHLDELLPPIIPLLTSHHHSLRGFTQLLVHQVLCKLVPTLDSNVSEVVPLEKKCFQDLKSYLVKNPDCMRLRSSMEGLLEVFNPKTSSTPAGIFTARAEESEFECVPPTLMEQVIGFLNDVREDLRCSMAKDVVSIKNEGLTNGGNCNSMILSRDADEEILHAQVSRDLALDFQKKVTLSKHEKQDTEGTYFLGNTEFYKPLVEMEKEDQLLDQVLQSRSIAIERIRKSRQQFILVASLIDRIPNLAGLARTCEVFKAAGLVISDASIVHDKQFQLISVTAEKWVPIIEVPVSSMKIFLEKKKREGFSILGLEQTANSIALDQYKFPQKMVLVLGREKEGIPVDIIHVLDACIEIPQLGVVRSLNVHVSGAIALWEYTRQHRS